MRIFIFLVSYAVGKVCVDVRGMNANDKLAKLKDLKLPHNALEIDDKTRIGIRKHFNIYDDTHGNTFYTLRYHNKDLIIIKQLSFHLKLVQKLKLKGLFLYETHFFCDNKWNYLVFSPQEASNNYLDDHLNSLTMQQTKNAYQDILRLFQIFEDNKAVFVKSHYMMILLSSKGKINFTPVDLAFVYEENHPCYIYLYAENTKNNFCSKPQTLVEGDKSLRCGIIKAKKTWNIHSFAYMIESYSSKHSMNKFEEKEKQKFSSFKNKLKVLIERALVGEPLEYNWQEMKDFIENFGESGDLADKINGESSVLMTIYNFYKPWFVNYDFKTRINTLPPRFRETEIVTEPSIIDLRTEDQKISLKVTKSLPSRSTSSSNKNKSTSSIPLLKKVSSKSESSNSASKKNLSNSLLPRSSLPRSSIMSKIVASQ